jgi:ankyrin repeat protein
MAMEKTQAHPNTGSRSPVRTAFVSAVLGFQVLANPVMAGVDAGTDAMSAPKNAKLDSDLLKAVKKKDAKAVERLLDQGADIEARDERGWTPLMSAIHAGQTENAKLLIARNADPNAKDNHGWTVLMTAAFEGDAEVGSLLIEKGAAVNAKDDTYGNTALMVVLLNSQRYEQFIALLTGNKADINLRNNEGSAPLMEAAFFGYKGVVVYLLQNGADADAVDKAGNTARSYALKRDHADIADILKLYEK